jgi:hypothetical protein
VRRAGGIQEQAQFSAFRARKASLKRVTRLVPPGREPGCASSCRSGLG